MKSDAVAKEAPKSVSMTVGILVTRSSGYHQQNLIYDVVNEKFTESDKMTVNLSSLVLILVPKKFQKVTKLQHAL